MKMNELTFNDLPQVVAMMVEKITFLEQKMQEIKIALKNGENPKKSEKSILTRKEAKDLLGVSYVTLNRWEKEGILPAQRMGSKVMYLIDDVYLALRGRAE